jgi:hypothetical protein
MVYVCQIYKKHCVFHSVLIALKPILLQQHKVNRLEFARNKIDAGGEYYQAQYNVMHINKTNYHVDKKTRRVFVGDGEVLQYRLNYVQMVMFLAAIAILVQWFPNVDPQNQQWDWDGTIGLYPLVEEHLFVEGITRQDFDKEIGY